MKVYNAWLSAEEGQFICRRSRPAVTIMKVNSLMISIASIFGADFSADDWEVVKKKHKLEFVNVDFAGTIDTVSITQIIRNRGLEKPVRFTKVCIEWEDV